MYGRDEWILWLLSLWIETQIVWESHEARFSFAARKLAVTIPIVVIAEGIREFYVGRGVDPWRILVAYDAVDDTIIWGIIIRHLPVLKIEVNNLLQS